MPAASFFLSFLITAVAVTVVDAAGAPENCEAGGKETCRGRTSDKVNKILFENSLPGSSSTEWDINGAGDPSIQGFATDISTPIGGQVTFKIRTDATSFRIDIYRMGYYNGNGARLVATVLPERTLRLPQKQPDCHFDNDTLLVDCVNWADTADWDVPEDAVSGIYFARLVRTDTEVEPVVWREDKSPVKGDPKFARAGVPSSQPPQGDLNTHAYGSIGKAARANALREPRASHIYFVIRDDSHSSAILVQTLDTTWQAYNCWGTTNTYGFPCDQSKLQAGSPEPPVKSRRAYKASYNRPFATRAYRAVNMPFNSEYPLVRWLERNGYDVSYWTGIDADRFGSRLPGAAHKIYISVGHDEYWSGRQREVITKARDNGMNLCFFSGNEAYWRVRWEKDAEGNRHRNMVIYKETQDTQKIDPDSSEWTGTFRDARPINPLGPWPENELTGTIFTVNAWRSDFLEVPAAFGRLRVWRNTSIAKASLDGPPVVIPVPGLLGHEWDEDIDNGFRPPGLMHLSKTTVENVQYLQDEGSTFDTGTATHHLTLYRRQENGALVFGAGTVQWSWGLDGHHDQVGGLEVKVGQNCYSLRVGRDQLVGDGNRDIQQATMNIFADMGTQPTSPQPNLVVPAPSSDVLAPFAADVSIASDGNLSVVEGFAKDVGGGTVSAVEVSTNGGKRWHPVSSLNLLTGQWSYRFLPTDKPVYDDASIFVRIVDDSGNFAEDNIKLGT